jgi:hypothetical protein
MSYVPTANEANEANETNTSAANPNDPRKQEDSVHIARVSGTLGIANANVGANGHNSPEFWNSTNFVSGVSDAEPCRVTHGRHEYAVERTADRQRVCIQCREPEPHSVSA